MKNSIKTFQITIEYDGSFFHGWQRQKEDRTIQGEIELALKVMTGHNIALIGSGRTDAGVHALAQVASFKLATTLTAQAFHRGLNSLISDDIVIKSCEIVSNDFHARFDVTLKTYRYHIMNDRLAFAVGRRFFWHIRKKIDLKSLELAASYFVGTHDFKAFEGAGSPRSHTIRTVVKSLIKSDNTGIITYTIEANGFLRYMVRNIVGTLVDVGLGKIQVEDINKLIKSRDRTKAGPTAPPHGLFLIRVDY